MISGFRCSVWGGRWVVVCWGGRCSVWWQNVNKVREGVSLVDQNWLLDNIVQKVGDEFSTLFWRDLWLDGSLYDFRYRRLFQVAKNKLVTEANVFFFRLWCA